MDGRASFIPLPKSDCGSMDSRPIGQLLIGKILCFSVRCDDFQQRGNYFIGLVDTHRALRIAGIDTAKP